MSLTKKSAGKSLLRTTTVAALALTSVVAVAGASQAATVLTMTSSAASGTTAGGNTIVLTLSTTNATAASNKFNYYANNTSGIQFQNVPNSTTQAAATCAAAPITSGAGTYANVTTTRFIGTTKVTAIVPTLSSGLTNNWIICAYDKALSDNTGTPIGKAIYTAAAAPTITSLNTYTQAAGPGSAALTGSNVASTGASTGGTQVAVVGTNFPSSGMTVLLGTTVSGGTTTNGIIAGGTITGGTPATIAGSPALTSTTFTANLPAKVGADLALTITTPGGSVTFPHAFSSINGITVTPNTVVQGSSVDVDVTGAGFLSYDFSNTGSLSGAGAVSGQDDATAHVFLARGVYDPSGYVSKAAYDADQLNQSPTLVVTAKANGQVAECTNVFVISDTELICTLNSAKKALFTATSSGGYTYPTSPIALGAYTMTIVDKADLTMSNTARTAVSVGSTFTVGQF